ncbi:MAG: sulfurtransferase TusA family protein [Desulfovibrio sp.]|jgi:TusA-related sulfurtransferase|nr:sulfurtransferase TusA family protein [Desulfovibrio sp.]
MKQIDARGLSCPQPVLLVKKAMASGENDSIEVLVDSAVAVENISRVASSLGWDVAATPKEDEVQLQLVQK